VTKISEIEELSLLSTYINDFNDELEDIANHFGFDLATSTGKGSAFERWIAEYFFNLSRSDANEIFFGGPGDKGIDIGIAKDFTDTIMLIQCKFSEKLLKGEIEVYDKEVINELLDGYNTLKEEDETNVSQNFLDLRTDYLSSIRSDKIVRKIVCIAGDLNSDAYKKARENNIEIYNYKSILDSIRFRSTYFKPIPDAISVSAIFKDTLIRIDSNDKLKSILIPIHARTIHELVQKYGDSLFIENLRLRLPTIRKDSIGIQIKRTAKEHLDSSSHENEYLFEILNNGLNIICNNVQNWNDIENQEANSLIQLVLIRPQIVNGCQTCWAIHDAVEDFYQYQINELNLNKKDAQDILDSKKLFVWAKIIPTENKQQQDKITYTTNTQNPIDLTDIKTKDPKHDYIKKECEKYYLPVFYDYKGGFWISYERYIKEENLPNKYKTQGKRSPRKFDMEEFAQLSISLQNQPYIARATKKTIFKEISKYNLTFNLENLDEENNVGLSWLESILFAYSIRNIGDIIRLFYTRKNQDIHDNIKNDPNPIFTSIDDFKNKRSFFCNYLVVVRYWNYLLISLIKGIIDFYCSMLNKSANKRDIYLRLYDITDSNLLNLAFYTSDLESEFNADDNLNSMDILDALNPVNNSKLNTIGSWLIHLPAIVADSIKNLDESSSFEFRSVKNLVEQNPQAITEILHYIEDNYLSTTTKRIQFFPGLD